MFGVLKKKVVPLIVRGNSNVRIGVPELFSTQIFVSLTADTPLYTTERCVLEVEGLDCKVPPRLMTVPPLILKSLLLSQSIPLSGADVPTPMTSPPEMTSEPLESMPSLLLA